MFQNQSQLHKCICSKYIKVLLYFRIFDKVSPWDMSHPTLWQYRLLSFQRRNTKVWMVSFDYFPWSKTFIWNYWILRIGVASCQILGIIIKNKGILKLMLSININKKNVLLRLYSSMKQKKNQKDSDDFWENWLESQILVLFDISPLHQFAKWTGFIWLQLIFSQKPF